MGKRQGMLVAKNPINTFYICVLKLTVTQHYNDCYAVITKSYDFSSIAFHSEYTLNPI